MLFASIRSIYKLKTSIEKLDTAKTKVAYLEKNNKEIIEKINYATTKEFIQEEAVKLNLTRPGEKIIIMGTRLPNDNDASLTGANSVRNEPNWRLWLNEFKLYR